MRFNITANAAHGGQLCRLRKTKDGPAIMRMRDCW